MTSGTPSFDLPRITLGVLAIGMMIGATAWVMRPFLLAVLWATMIVIATWPMLLGLQGRMGGRRGPAVALMVAALLALIVVPTWVGVAAIARNSERIGELVHTVATEGLPPPPAWLDRIPFVGESLSGKWAEFTGDPDAVTERIKPHAKEVASWLAAKAGGVGSTFVQLLLMVAVAGILYASGETAANGVLRFLRRLGGERAENSGRLAGKAVRAVALGIVVTALAQTAIAGIGLAASGVPHAGALTGVVLVLCIAQLGPALVLIPATIWLYTSGSPVRGTILLAVSVLALTLDNVLRPILIRKGADLPFLLIMAGVIGGVLAFGIVGLFVGPVLLAVSWTLLVAWVGDVDRAREAGT